MSKPPVEETGRVEDCASSLAEDAVVTTAVGAKAETESQDSSDCLKAVGQDDHTEDEVAEDCGNTSFKVDDSNVSPPAPAGTSFLGRSDRQNNYNMYSHKYNHYHRSTTVSRRNSNMERSNISAAETTNSPSLYTGDDLDGQSRYQDYDYDVDYDESVNQDRLFREEDEIDSCMICTDIGQPTSPLFTTPCCHHPMHLDCLFLWRIRNPTCPSCRRPTAEILQAPEDLMDEFVNMAKTVLNVGDPISPHQNSSRLNNAPTHQTNQQTGTYRSTRNNNRTHGHVQQEQQLVHATQGWISFAAYGVSDMPIWLQSLECPFCGEEFTSDQSLEAHLQETTDHDVFVCCRLVFATTVELDRHRRTSGHTDYQTAFRDGESQVVHEPRNNQRVREPSSSSSVTRPQQLQNSQPSTTSRSPAPSTSNSDPITRLLSRPANLVPPSMIPPQVRLLANRTQPPSNNVLPTGLVHIAQEDVQLSIHTPPDLPIWLQSLMCPYCEQEFTSDHYLEQHLQSTQDHEVLVCCRQVFVGLHELESHRSSMEHADYQCRVSARMNRAPRTRLNPERPRPQTEYSNGRSGTLEGGSSSSSTTRPREPVQHRSQYYEVEQRPRSRPQYNGYYDQEPRHSPQQPQHSYTYDGYDRQSYDRPSSSSSSRPGRYHRQDGGYDRPMGRDYEGSRRDHPPPVDRPQRQRQDYGPPVNMINYYDNESQPQSRRDYGPSRREREPPGAFIRSQPQSSVDLRAYDSWPMEKRPEWMYFRQCPYCRMQFHTYRLLQEHLRTVEYHHVYTCCGRVYLSMGRLHDHIERFHGMCSTKNG